MTVTLADVARAAGLSPSTVSRALSAPEKVNSATRERVRRIAREMDYVPNQVARSLTSGANDVIGLIVPDISNPFFPPIIKAVQARASSRGKSVVIADVDEHPDDELERAKMLRRRVDGLIIVAPRTAEDKIQALAELTPIVFVNRIVEGSANVVIENQAGMLEAVEHLVALGHKKIGYLNGPRRSWANSQRREAITHACHAHSVELTEFGPFEPQIQAGVRAADLVHASDVTAVIAYDDMIAMGLMSRFHERGVRIGHDISVIGIDDSPMSGMAYPTLTSIQVPGAKAGTTAVDIVLSLADNHMQDLPNVQLETNLIVRGSTSLAPSSVQSRAAQNPAPSDFP